jgi:ADP-ribose pyrophosphatase
MRPWKILSESAVITDPWLGVSAVRAELPNGVVLDPYYVVHEKEWTHVCAFDEAGDVVLVRQYRYPGKLVSLELPGGVIDPGEAPLEAAKRELLEETGYVSDEWIEAGTMLPNPARQANRLHVFVARNARCVAGQALDASEEIEVAAQPVERVMLRIASGEFVHAMHVASFMRSLMALSRLQVVSPP